LQKFPKIILLFKEKSIAKIPENYFIILGEINCKNSRKLFYYLRRNQLQKFPKIILLFKEKSIAKIPENYFIILGEIIL